MAYIHSAAFGMLFFFVFGKAHCLEGQELPKSDLYLIMADEVGEPTTSWYGKRLYPEIDDFYIFWEPRHSPINGLLVKDFSNVRGKALAARINPLSTYEDGLKSLILPGSELSQFKWDNLKKIKGLSVIIVDSCLDRHAFVRFKQEFQDYQLIESQQSAIDFVQNEDDGLTTAVLNRSQSFPKSISKFYDRHSYRVVQLTRRRDSLPVVGAPLSKGIIDRLPIFAASLVTLDLSESTINDMRMTLLAELRLECLILDNTDVSEIGIRKLNCDTLKRLKCNGCKIANKIPKMPVLEALDLSDNPIKDEFFSECEFPKLRLLDISGTKVTSGVLTEIEKFQSLEYLVLDESFRGAKELDKILNKKIKIGFY